MKKRILAIVLAALMCLSVMAGCGKDDSKSTNSKASGSDKNSTPLVVGYNQFNEKFSPFFAESGYDQDVASMTQVQLLTNDRSGAIILNGIEGETTSYNGKDYNYTGIANIAVEQATDTTTYKIKIRDDVKFSDGHVLDADDVIFSYYVLLDKSYTGNSTLNSLDIVGYQDYLYNYSGTSSLDPAAELKKPSDKTKEALTALVKENLESEYAWCGENFEAAGAESQIAFFITCYNTDEKADFAGKKDEEVVAAVAAQYGADYVKFATAYGDPTFLDAAANDIALTNLAEAAKSEGTEVPNIAGIKKISQTEIELTTNGFGASDVYQVGNSVAPMHYYGDESLYNYEENKFGFTRGDLSIVESKTTKPMGAGPYKFVKYENKVVYFEANENYYKGCPKIKSVQFKETDDKDKINGVQQGTIDMTDPSLSVENAKQIGEINGNSKLVGDVITTSTVPNLGYGYIGINADVVKVGDKADSAESKNLRRAIATVLSVYRDLAIDSYYGDTAEVINYPMSSTSWAAPVKSDEGYKVAYSVDVDGKDIYTADMSEDQRYEAALKAAVGFLKAAGYTYDEASGKFTAAPKGASMSYEATIGADGSGDHPNFLILSEASKAFEKIGITFTVNDVEWATLSNQVSAGQQVIWTMAWGATIDPDMYQVYHSSNAGGGSNYYSIKDDTLDDLILKARTNSNQSYRKAVYKDCLDIVLDWAVEIPVYQRDNCVIFSTSRIKAATITPDITPFYPWLSEVENMEMN